MDMEFVKRFKLFGLYVYVTNVRMKRRSKSDRYMRNHREKLMSMKKVHYERQGGMCKRCGEQFSEGELEVHHKKGLSEDKSQALSMDNLELLCHACHRSVHERRD